MDAYKPWVLALIFLSILILIAGVVLLTNEKPDPAATKASASSKSLKMHKLRSPSGGKGKESKPLTADETEEGEGDASKSTLWEVGGDESEDEDHPEDDGKLKPSGSGLGTPGLRGADDVRSPFIGGPSHDDEDDELEPQKTSMSQPNKARGVEDDDDEFGDWEDGGKVPLDTPPQR